jgi:hypothetical protein
VSQQIGGRREMPWYDAGRHHQRQGCQPQGMRRSPDIVFDPADGFPLRLRQGQLIQGEALGDRPRRLLPIHLQRAEGSGSGKVEDGQDPAV